MSGLRCPVCERPVARGALRCPYCEERLPGAARYALARFAPWLVPPALATIAWAALPGRAVAAVVAAGVPVAAALAVRMARDGFLRRLAGLWALAVGAVAVALALDPALRADALQLWRAHGAGLALAAAAVSALCPAIPPDAVSGAAFRERLAAALLRRAPDVLGAAIAAALSFRFLPAPLAGVVLAAAVLFALTVVGSIRPRRRRDPAWERA